MKPIYTITEINDGGNLECDIDTTGGSVPA